MKLLYGMVCRENLGIGGGVIHKIGLYNKKAVG